MASEIRVNSLSSRTGLSTVTFTDTGPIFSGITTFQDNSGFNVGTGGSIFSPASNTVTLGTNSAERFRIASNGNIGIGTDNPGAKTHIDSTTNNTPLVVEASQNNRSRIVFRNNVETGTECNVELIDDDLRFVTNSGERLRIDSSGRLKVGVTNDIIWNQTSEDGVVIEQSGATQIVRNGDVPLLVTRNTSTGQIVKFSQAGTERGSILYDGDFGIASAGNLTFDISGTERLRITSDGKVGINTDMGGAPASLYPFSVYRSTGTGYVYTETAQSGASAGLRAKAGTADFTIFTTEGTGQLAVYDNTNNAQRLKIDSSGKLKLGSNTLVTPNTDADNFVIDTGDVDSGISILSATTGRIYFGDAASNDQGSIRYVHTDNSMRFETNSTEKLRITSGGDVLIGGQTAYTYDDTGASNTILDITNSTNNKRGILSLSGNSNANGPSIGTIWFNNDQNSGTGPGATMKLAAAIQAKAVTSDSNAGDDSGAYLQFLTKPESAALAESMVIHSDGEIIKPLQPGFFTRRAVGGDGRSGGAQEWSVSGTGSFNTGSHFNASNGRFTAPIAGRYLFTAAPGYKQTGQNFNFYFRINGGDASEGCRFVDGGDDLTSHSIGTATVIYNLSVNDYVDVYIGSTHHVNLTYNFFMGYLLG